MNRRVIRKAAGAAVLVLALAMEGRIIGQAGESAGGSMDTVGQVEAVLAEPGSLKGERTADWEFSAVSPRPGETIAKEPTIFMGTDSEPAYLRIRILVEGLDEEKERELLAGIERTEGWNLNPADGYYYYKDPVKGEESVSVFRSISIPKDWDGTEKFQMRLAGNAVQASGLTPVFDAECQMAGWAPAPGQTSYLVW